MENCKDVKTLCADLGIDLRGNEWHPFHCGERMQTKTGIVGTDYARCRQCGLTIGNILSPHINGGHVSTDPKVWEDRETWIRLDDTERAKGEKNNAT